MKMKMKFEFPSSSDKIELKPYTITDLAKIYSVSRATFHTWIRPFKNEIGERRGLFLTIPQVQLIFDKLELPSTKVIRIELKQAA